MKFFPPTEILPGNGEVQGVSGAGGVGAEQVPTKLATGVPEQQPPDLEMGSNEYVVPLLQQAPSRDSPSYVNCCSSGQQPRDPSLGEVYLLPKQGLGQTLGLQKHPFGEPSGVYEA